MATRREQNRETTRRAILQAARQAFGRGGFEAAGLVDIARGARVTTGAIYHHFGDKRGLFRHVAETIEGEILAALGRILGEVADPWDRLVAAVLGSLELCRDPELRQIIFLDAPDVIGASEWREIEQRFAYGALCQMLVGLQDAGRLRPVSVTVLAPMVLGAMIEAAGAVAGSAEPDQALDEARDALRLMLEAYKAPVGEGGSGGAPPPGRP